MENGGEKYSILVKPSKSSTMTHEESEEIQNQLLKLENQFNKLSDRSVKNVDFLNTQRKIRKMEQNIDQNIDQKMEKLQIFMAAMF